MSGPPPKPSVVRKAEGNPGRLLINENEPNPPSDKLVCPSYLNDIAREEWDRLMDAERRMGGKLFTEFDIHELAIYCDAVATITECNKYISSTALMFQLKNDDGSLKYIQQNPYVSMKNKAFAILKGMAADFGFNPAARTRVSMLPDGGKNEEEDEFG